MRKIPDEGARTIPMEPAQLSQTSIPTYITPSDQSSRPAPLSAPESNRSSFPTFEAPPAASPPLISSDRSLDKLRPERGISRRIVVVGLGIVGLGACGGVSAWAATGGLQQTLRALGLLNAPTPTPTTPTTPTTLPQPDPSTRTAPLVGSLLQTYRGHTRSLWTAAWSPDGKRIASGGDDGMVQIWDPVTGSRILIYDGYLSRDQNPSVVTLSWSPDGKRIVSGAVFLDHTVQVRDATTGSNAFIYHGYDNQVNVLDWSPDSKRIVLAGLDSTVQVWQGA